MFVSEEQWPADVGNRFRLYGLYTVDDVICGVDNGVMVVEMTAGMTSHAVCCSRRVFSQSGKHFFQDGCPFRIVADIFVEENGLWRRKCEEHLEYIYEQDEVESYLKSAGFIDVCRYGDLKFRKPTKRENRIFFTCRKPN